MTVDRRIKLSETDPRRASGDERLRGSGVLEGPPDRLRGLPEGAEKRPPHVLAVAEAGFHRDGVNRVLAFVEHNPSRFKSEAFNGSRRRLSRF